MTGLPIYELAAQIREQRISPVRLLEQFKNRFDTFEKKLGCFITPTWEDAFLRAGAAERELAEGVYRSPLHGIPFAIKDLFFTKGVRTTGGSRILMDFVPSFDATVVSKLKQAGAVITGKLTMHEFAYGGTNNNPHYGPCRNPWSLDRIPGGSSGGSGAAVASSLCAASLGSDTGGSVRMPASYCGIVGLKPTFGRVSNFGVLPLSWSQDHVGPMAKRVEDVALTLGAISGHDPMDPATSAEPISDFTSRIGSGVEGLAIGAISSMLRESSEDVEAAVRHAMEILMNLGARVREVEIPALKWARSVQAVITAAEAYAYHETNLKDRPQDYGAEVRQRLLVGAGIPASDYIRAHRLRRVFIDELALVLKDYDLLLSPTMMTTPPKIGDEFISVRGKEIDVATMLIRLTSPFNLSGNPAISVPCGFSKDGLPIGLQLIGRPMDEALLLRAAHAYEGATNWHTREPQLA